METIEFFQKAHIAGFESVNKICAKQYPGFVPVSGGLRLEGVDDRSFRVLDVYEMFRHIV